MGSVWRFQLLLQVQLQVPLLQVQGGGRRIRFELVLLQMLLLQVLR